VNPGKSIEEVPLLAELVRGFHNRSPKYYKFGGQEKLRVSGGVKPAILASSRQR
jgi:hypothetical protein